MASYGGRAAPVGVTSARSSGLGPGRLPRVSERSPAGATGESPPPEGDTRPVIMFTIPAPPSANGIYANRRGGGRIKTAAYRKWRKAAAEHIAYVERVGPLPTPAEIVISLPRHLTGDADNRIKPTVDAIVASGALPGDTKKHVNSAKAQWTQHDVCTVSVRQAVASD